LLELSQECRELAYEMVRLEAWARKAYLHNEFERVGELHQRRDEARERRSQLLREFWSRRGRRLCREALRHA
jgi:hypothetical protein